MASSTSTTSTMQSRSLFESAPGHSRKRTTASTARSATIGATWRVRSRSKFETVTRKTRHIHRLRKPSTATTAS
eukprot:6448463-Pyramimonas_sp.AAC.1